MNVLKEKIIELTEQIIPEHECVLIDVVLRGDSRNRIIEIYVDNEDGITLDDCSLISRKINEGIERDEVIKSKYRLDVSSPGTERPLKYLLQYKKHIGRKLEVDFLENDEKNNEVMELTAVDDKLFTFRAGKDERVIPFEKIIKAKVIISF